MHELVELLQAEAPMVCGGMIMNVMMMATMMMMMMMNDDIVLFLNAPKRH